MSMSRSKMVNRLVERKDFLDTRIKEIKARGGSEKDCTYDCDESEALAWILLELSYFTLNHHIDREWAEKLTTIVPIERYSEDRRIRNKAKRAKCEKRLLAILEKHKSPDNV